MVEAGSVFLDVDSAVRRFALIAEDTADRQLRLISGGSLVWQCRKHFLHYTPRGPLWASEQQAQLFSGELDPSSEPVPSAQLSPCCCPTNVFDFGGSALFICSWFPQTSCAARRLSLVNDLSVPEHEVLDSLNELDGDGFCVHRRPWTDPPMSFKSVHTLVGELRSTAQHPALAAIGTRHR